MDIVRVFENDMKLLICNTEEKEKDWTFLNCLWQYVVISKNICRTLPECLYCGYEGEFCFEGFGAIKKVGNGIIYIPALDGNVYVIPDMVFHYLYMHTVKPTKFFEEMVYSAPKPYTEEYINIIKKVYYERDDRLQEFEKINCKFCNRKFTGKIVYQQGKKNSIIKIYHHNYFFERLKGEKYVGLCANCFHLTRL